MGQLNKLADAVDKAPNEGMKKIWTDKWFALVKQYAKEMNYEYESERSTTIPR
tara:strand:+ start:910 stop:1068 length:159 start_codon:yes stop_codon:yes gene_type:complete